MLAIDCSRGEGGGGAFRSALMLSAITKSPIHLKNIRVRREDSGIGRTHLTLLNLVAQMTNATTNGADIGSTELFFIPQHLPTGDIYQLSLEGSNLFMPYYGSISVERNILEGKDTLTPPVHNFNGVSIAGQAVTTYLAILAPVLAFSNQSGMIEAFGGTDVPAAQSMESFENLYLRIIREIGVDLEVKTLKRGLLGIGGGIVQLRCNAVSKALSPVRFIDADPLNRIECYIHCFGSQKNSELELRKELISVLESIQLDIPINIHITLRNEYPKTGIEFMFLIFREKTSLPLHMEIWGEEFNNSRNIKDVFEDRLKSEILSGPPLSRYICDQIIPLMGLAEGKSVVVTDKITPHINSAIYVTEAILGAKIHQKEIGRNLYEISTDGIGYCPF